MTVGNEANAEACFESSMTAISELEVELRVVLVLVGRFFRFLFCVGTYAILSFSDPVAATGADAIEVNTIKKERVLMSIPCI